MKSLNGRMLFEQFCVDHKKYGVYIAGYQFDLDEDERWEEFCTIVKDLFQERDALDILVAVLNSEYMVFDDAKDATKLYSIMISNYFYSHEYACMFTPDGMSDENT